MAGSKKGFIYTTDKGKDYGIVLDESNTKAVNGGTNTLGDAATATEGVPRNITPRYLTYASADGKRVIKVTALTPTIYQGAFDNIKQIDDPITSGQKLTLLRGMPERVKIIRGVDTGLTDP
jgi:hypothetical protein